MPFYRVDSPFQLGQYVKSYNRMIRVSFWIGAGVSASAGIPTADALAAQIEERFGFLLGEKSPGADKLSPFAAAFANLAPLGRKVFLHEAASMAAGVNRAHELLAQMNLLNCINLILTTNFDNLLIRAHDLLSAFNPWVVDARCDLVPDAEALRPGCLVYLNGFANAYRASCEPAEAESMGRLARKAVERSSQNSAVVVLGYSGVKDPLLDALASHRDYPHGLFWVTKDPSPSSLVSEKILDIPNARFLGGWNADDFVSELAGGLGLVRMDAPPKPERAAPATASAPEPAPKEPEKPKKAESAEKKSRKEPKAPADALGEDEIIKIAGEALLIGGTEELLAVARNALKDGLEKTYKPLSEALLDWGNQMLGEGDLNLAHAALGLVNELDPENLDAYVSLKDVAEKKGDASLAARLSLKILSLKK